MSISASEFIQNSDGSVYHLNLLPGHLADTIITVGDPGRVNAVTKHFDRIEFAIHKREFHTQTGFYKGKRLSVISTGIGTDNIDIVLNELDALVNIDFKTKELKKETTSLNIIRIGTSGALHEDIPLDSFLASEAAVGMDNLLHFYKSEEVLDKEFAHALRQHLGWKGGEPLPYVVSGDDSLISNFQTYKKGITLTNSGFYGPQGRVLRLALKDPEMNDKLASFRYQNKKLTNLEMETAGIYGLSKLLGHRALSLNAIVANRATGEFSKDPKQTVEGLIESALDIIAGI